MGIQNNLFDLICHSFPIFFLSLDQKMLMSYHLFSVTPVNIIIMNVTVFRWA